MRNFLARQTRQHSEDPMKMNQTNLTLSRAERTGGRGLATGGAAAARKVDKFVCA
jgi:hypothetical protein